MDFRNNRLTIAEAKEIDMVIYLSSLGHEPSKIKGNSYWYHSPLHEEKTPSFTVNRNRNIWYDFGLGKGGSIIDFGILYHNCSIPEILQLLSGDFSFIPTPVVSREKVKNNTEESKIKVTRESIITSPSLLRYLDERKIPLALAEQYCKEVRFETGGKNYYGIGFKNDAGGYEIRNPYFKGSSSPKDITTVRNDVGRVSVFEGFFDFLSYLTLHSQLKQQPTDYLILNTLSFFEKSLNVLNGYGDVRLYLDNNTAGQKCTSHALSLGNHYKNESRLYKGYEDLDDFLLTGKGIKNKVHRKGIRH
jgi:hypothetical protein